jgi:3-hydroxyacyl-[acyl-carrier-protein] dehydratase
MTVDKGETAMQPLDICAILKHLPHRYPFLMIDRVVECIPGKSIRGLKNVTINEPFFQGHFPAFPVMPGVMVIEALAQISGLLAFASGHAKPDGKSLIFFAGIDNARFKRQVIPGDQLILESEVIRVVRGVGKFRARASVGDEIACEAELLAAIRGMPVV